MSLLSEDLAKLQTLDPQTFFYVNNALQEAEQKLANTEDKLCELKAELEKFKEAHNNCSVAKRQDKPPEVARVSTVILHCICRNLSVLYYYTPNTLTQSFLLCAVS